MNVLICLLLIMWGVDPPVSKVNKLKKQAQAALQAARYEVAIEKYAFLIDSLGVDEPALGINRAHAYLATKDSLRALQAYQKLDQHRFDKGTQAMLLNQIGVLSKGKVADQERLSLFKQALSYDPGNDIIRYNYQRIMQRLQHAQDKEQSGDQQQDKEQSGEQQQDKEQSGDQQQDKEQSGEQQQDKEQSGEQQQDKQQSGEQQQDKEQSGEQQQDKEQSGEQQQDKEQSGEQQQDKEQSGEQQQDKEQSGEQQQDKEQSGEQQQDKEQSGEQQPGKPPSTSERLQQINISEARARQILEAMRSNELQYLQQLKRKATKPKDASKPDW